MTSINFLKTDRYLTSNQKKLISELREWADKKIIPNIGNWYQQGLFPKEIISDLAKFNIYGGPISGWNCPAMDYLTYGLILKELERADSGIRSFMSVHSSLAMYPISKWANSDIQQSLLPNMASGNLIGSFALTEPNFGSNPSDLQTSFSEQNDLLLLNGHKKWVTNGELADIIIVWAKNQSTKKIEGLIVDSKLPGITIKPIKNKFSLRVSNSTEIIFKNVEVNKKYKLNVSGLKGPFSCLNQARYGISWGVLGAAEACYEEVKNYSLNRVQFNNAPLASHQLVQAKLVYMLQEITLGTLLCLELSKLMDNDLIDPNHISLAKMNNVSKSLKICRKARDILGANGITYDYHSGRHMQNLETVNTYEGTEDIHRLILGKHITGISAF